MADNYLEKHYADYEQKRAAWEKAKKLGKAGIQKFKEEQLKKERLSTPRKA